MGATLTTVSAITKELYGPRIVDQLESETTALKRIEKSSQGVTSEVGGKYVTFPLKVRRNQGIGYRNELEQLQNPGQQGWQSVRVGLKYGYGRVHLSGPAIKLVETNAQAFASAITKEMDGLKQDLLKDTNRIIWGDGLGVVATIDAGANSATQSLGTTVDDLHFVDIGMPVDVISADGLTVRSSNNIITAVNESTGNVTLTSSVNSTTGDILVRTGNYGKEPQGFGSLVSDSTATLFNLSSTTEPKWKSYVDSTGGALSESKMVAVCDRLRTNGGAPSVIFTDLGSRRAYFNLLTTQRRITTTQEFAGGFKGLAFAYDQDIPLVTDVDAPRQKMWFLREEDFKIYRESPWAFDDMDGGIWKWVNNYDAYEAMMKQYWEFAVERRNTQAVMTGITAG